jgi:hypothetical protein
VLAGSRPPIVSLLGLCCGLAVLAIVPPARPARADLNALSAARATISAQDVRQHVDVLAADSFEGREAGQRGGRAAGIYLMKAFRACGLQPAGDGGTYFQQFGAGYRNILGIVPGQDPELSEQYVLVSAHYDHVGYGNWRNSNGPTGYIHNGADDNASGTAAVLELAQALPQLKPRRSVLLALWDAEEMGLLGSRHWLQEPSVPASRVRVVINLDMVGRLREKRLQVIGSRSMAGLRECVSRANGAGPLRLSFPWLVEDNSDHYPFLERQVPILMFHTGLHDDYHRPSDDAEKVVAEGVEAVAALLLETVWRLSERDVLPNFRPEANRESTLAQRRYERVQPAPAPRLGISWRPAEGAEGGLLVRTVRPGSAAFRAGLQPGDRIVGLDGEPLVQSDVLQSRVVAAAEPLQMTIARPEQEALTIDVPLDGDPVRLGIAWRENSGEPGAVMISRVVAGSVAGRAGLKPRDRIYEVNGEPFRDSRHFHQLVTQGSGTLGLLLERDGQLRNVSLQPAILAGGDANERHPDTPHFVARPQGG